ncbi:MAG: substrate-binding domain-containing protein [Bacteroidota bacterium]
MNKKIRIKDIAKMANVSVGTVDRVIHNRGEVSKDSYSKIMGILEKTGYKPNLIARTLGSHKTFRIAAVVPNPQQDEYWGLSNQGIKQAQEEWNQYGVQVQPFYFDLYDKNSFQQVAQSALDTAPDGILMAPIFYQEAAHFFQACKESNIPFVLFNNNLPDAGSLSFIGQDLYQSGRVGAELLHLSQTDDGTYAILHIYDDIHNSVHLYEKEKGFKEYFEEQKGKNFTVKSIDLNYTHEPTLEKELNELLSDTQLKGLLVTTSKGAFVVSKLLEKHGKNGVRLVAYDLLQENLHYLNKGIIDFLINQNSKRQAFMGIGQLANNLLFQKEASPTYLFPLEIISRQNLKTYLNSEAH